MSKETTTAIVAYFLKPDERKPLADAVDAAKKAGQLPADSQVQAAEDMHITLCYIGETTALEAAGITEEKLAVLVEQLASQERPVSASVEGTDLFDAGRGGGEQATRPYYAAISSAGLRALRQELNNFLTVSAVPVVNDWLAYNPHVTLAYVPAEDDAALALPALVELPASLKFEIDRLTIAWGDRRQDIAISGSLYSGVPAGDLALPTPTTSEPPSETGEINKVSQSQQQLSKKNTSPARLEAFVKISKIDEEKRMVYGIATSESIDSEGEIIDYDAIKAAWPDYIKFGNIRAMHNGYMAAAGVVKEWELRDEDRQLWIGVYVADDQDWEKVKTGVYKGFSIGGEILDYKMEQIDGRLVRRVIELRLNEISLVDRPACPDALIEFYNAYNGGKMQPNIETLIKAAQAHRDTAELGGDRRAAKKWSLAIKMITKCGDSEVSLAEGEDQNQKPEDEDPRKRQGFQDDDMGGDLGGDMDGGGDMGGADIEASYKARKEAGDQEGGEGQGQEGQAAGSAPTNPDAAADRRDMADYLDQVADLAALIGGDHGRAIMEAIGPMMGMGSPVQEMRRADGAEGEDKKPEGEGAEGEDKKPDELDEMKKSIAALMNKVEQLLVVSDKQFGQVKNIVQNQAAVATTVNKMVSQSNEVALQVSKIAKQPAPASINKMGVPAPALTPEQAKFNTELKIEKQAKVPVLQAKLRAESNPRIREQYQKELSALEAEIEKLG